MWLDSRESTLWLHVSGYVGSGSFLSSLGVNYTVLRRKLCCRKVRYGLEARTRKVQTLVTLSALRYLGFGITLSEFACVD